MATGKTAAKESKISGGPTSDTAKAEGVGPTSGVMAPGPVGRAARDAAHAATNDANPGPSLRDRALVGRPILVGHGIDDEGETPTE